MDLANKIYPDIFATENSYRPIALKSKPSAIELRDKNKTGKNHERHIYQAID